MNSLRFKRPGIGPGPVACADRTFLAMPGGRPPPHPRHQGRVDGLTSLARLRWDGACFRVTWPTRLLSGESPASGRRGSPLINMGSRIPVCRRRAPMAPQP